MSLEEQMAELTAAVKEQTAFLKQLQGKGGAASSDKPATTAKDKPATTTAKKVTIDTIKEKFGAFLGTDDKKLRAKRIEQVGAMMNHYGVEKATLLEESQWKEALGYLKQLEEGDTPSYMSDDGDGEEGESLV